MRELTTGTAAAAIGNDGKFRLREAGVTRAGELTAVEAIALTSAWMEQYGPVMRTALEAARGGTVVPAKLKSCGRALYARSAFVPPPTDIPAVYRRPYGPWWLVTFCDDADVPTASVAVSAWATDLALTDGKLTFPRISGNEFVATAIPMGHVGEFPSPPESAVELAGREAGKRITKVPDLVMPYHANGMPQTARWHIALEGAATLRSVAGDIVSGDVFVGPPGVRTTGLAMFVAAPTQPLSVSLEWVPLPAVGEQGAAYIARARTHVQMASVARRSDSPITLDPVTLREGR